MAKEREPDVIGSYNCATGDEEAMEKHIKTFRRTVEGKCGGPVKVMREGNQVFFYVNWDLRGRLTLANFPST